ncbi:MAG: GMP synthase (glutamine-hydrolyzing) [Phototrophicales bacterium]|nr:MAG: GMP synthase (glutamine-hydrolyzing) [Phototrophicales bacterium]
MAQSRTDARLGGIVILDYGSQYTQLIARRIRELGVYAELWPFDIAAEQALTLQPKGIILSGGPNSVYDENAPYLPQWVLDQNIPVLGICYGMQLLTHTLGGKVSPAHAREYGPATVTITHQENMLLKDFPQTFEVWMSHGDHIETPPPYFVSLGYSTNSPYAIIGNTDRNLFGVQFHPEVVHTPLGRKLLSNFVFHICQCQPDWTPAHFIEQAIVDIQSQVGDAKVVMALSGGVDSMVAATLIHKAIGEQLTCIFVDNGLLRLNEAHEVVETVQNVVGAKLIAVKADELFLDRLAGVTDPEQKRKIIGETFIHIFEEEAAKIEGVRFLGQGTIYPDVIESAAKERPHAQTIKTHHNVGGLPEEMTLELVEPLRYLFKDEVRLVGEALGLPERSVWRQPFPGPGLAIRCLGEVTFERLERLRLADKIFRDALAQAGLMREIAQAYAALLPVKSVGVMGDQRTYAETIVLRAVTTEDFMTADWAKLPYELLTQVSNRIVNEVEGVNRVVYDISTKPPATIEWE